MIMRHTAAAVVALTLLAVSCGEDSSGEITSATGDGPSADPTLLWVAPETVDCVGEAPQKCLQVKRSEDAEWELFYDEIEGFTHVEGTSYILDVEVTEVDDPPAGGSSLRYRLVTVVESTES